MAEELKITEPKPVPKFKINEAAFQPADASRMTWTITLPPEHQFDEVLDPVFWSHVARKIDMKFHNFIEVYREDRTLFGSLYVRGVSGNNVYVAVIDRPLEWGKAAPVPAGGLTTKWNVGKGGFDVIRADDKQVVADGKQFPLREQAEAWIAQQRKSLAA